MDEVPEELRIEFVPGQAECDTPSCPEFGIAKELLHVGDLVQCSACGQYTSKITRYEPPADDGNAPTGA